jgi:hypothetical protein
LHHPPNLIDFDARRLRVATGAFGFGHQDFVGRFAVWVQEAALVNAGLTPNQGAGPVVAPGTRVALPAANYIMNFKFDKATHSDNIVVLTVSPGALPGSRRCYFLPWCPDGATEITLGNGAPYFFTSTLTGCSVKVHGLKATPTVIHANARGTYTNAYLPTFNATAGDDQQKHATAEAHASHQAQTGINAMLGAAVAGQGVVTKADYVGQATLPNIKAAGKKMQFGQGYKLKWIKPDLHSNVKLQSGGFVYGVLGAGGWDFYYQASLVVKGKAVQKGAFKHGTKPMINEEVVLGAPTHIF